MGMRANEFWDDFCSILLLISFSQSFVDLPDDFNQSTVKGCSRPRGVQKIMLSGIKRGLFPMWSLNEKELSPVDISSSVSSKDSCRITMALVAHFGLELHQMDTKTTFRNG